MKVKFAAVSFDEVNGINWRLPDADEIVIALLTFDGERPGD